MKDYRIRQGCTYFHTFSFQCKEYLLNTSVKIKDGMFTTNLKPLYDRPLVQVVEHFIDQRGTARWTYALWNYDGGIWLYTTTQSPDDLVECIEQIATGKPTHEEKAEYYKDSEVPVVKMGWLIYIAVMLGSMIFNGFIVAWVFGTMFFFSWRKEKLRKPVKYEYGFNVYKKVEEWHERKT